jgi:uncharacterized glyoxalase superfamily protein PhnB
VIVPYFVYRDGGAALEFLEDAFGLRKVTDYRGGDGAVIHAEMTHGGCAIMLGTATDEQRAAEPWDQPTGRGIYLVVDDVDAHYEHAKGAGAEIVYPPEDTDFGTRRYRARDLDGYEWSFGTYRPWTGDHDT